MLAWLRSLFRRKPQNVQPERYEASPVEAIRRTHWILRMGDMEPRLVASCRPPELRHDGMIPTVGTTYVTFHVVRVADVVPRLCQLLQKGVCMPVVLEFLDGAGAVVERWSWTARVELVSCGPLDYSRDPELNNHLRAHVELAYEGDFAQERP